MHLVSIAYLVLKFSGSSLNGVSVSMSGNLQAETLPSTAALTCNCELA